MRLNCIRRSCTGQGVKTEVHTATVEIGFDGRHWVKLSPGVTGYESASVDDLLREHRALNEWYACAGTEGVWDQLLVPEAEMDRLKDVLRLIPQPKDETK